MRRQSGIMRPSFAPTRVTATGFSPRETRALEVTLLARGVHLSRSLDRGCAAVIVRDPFSPPRSDKINVAREHAIPCVTHSWVVQGQCSLDALPVYELRGAVWRQNICVMGLRDGCMDSLQEICGGTCQATLTATCKVLVMPDRSRHSHYVPNKQKLDFAARHGIPCMLFSDFTRCYGPAKALPSDSGDFAAQSSCQQSPWSPMSQQSQTRGSGSPQWGLVHSAQDVLLTGREEGGSRRRRGASPEMEAMTDVCVFSVAVDPAAIHEVAFYAEAAGARLATNPVDPGITHVLLRDEELTMADASATESSPSFTLEKGSALFPRSGLQFVRLSWLVECVKRRHRVSCLAFCVRVVTRATSSLLTNALPVLAFSTLTPPEEEHLCKQLRQANLFAIVQHEVICRAPGHQPSTRSRKAPSTTHLVVPRDRVEGSAKVRILLEKFAAVPGGIPVTLVDVAWVVDSVASRRWRPCEPYLLEWPQPTSTVTSGRPSVLVTAAALACPPRPPQADLPPVPARPTNSNVPVQAESPRQQQQYEEEEEKNIAEEASEMQRHERKRPRSEEGDLRTRSTVNNEPEDAACLVEGAALPANDKESETHRASGASSTAPEWAAATPTSTPTASVSKRDDSGADQPSHTAEDVETKEAPSATDVATADPLAPKEQLAYRSIADEPCSCTDAERYETASFSMTLQQRWEDLEARAAVLPSVIGPSVTAAVRNLHTAGNHQVLGEENDAVAPENVEGGSDVIGCLLPHARQLRISDDPGGLAAPFLGGISDSPAAARHNFTVRTLAESQQVFYNHRCCRMSEGKHGNGEEADLSSPASGGSVQFSPFDSFPVRLFVEGDILSGSSLEERLFQAKPHWARVATVEECTHYVTGELTAGVRLLVSIAQGKWVLQPSFLHATVAATLPSSRRSSSSRFHVEEEAHEWTRAAAERLGMSRSTTKLAAACALRRSLARAQYPAPHQPFAKWKVTVTCCASRFASFKRVLESGGCQQVVAASAEELLYKATLKENQVSARTGQTLIKKCVDVDAENDNDAPECLVFSDMQDWDVEQLAAYTDAVGQSGPRVLLVDYIMHFLCTQDPCEERDLVLHKKLQKRNSARVAS